MNRKITAKFRNDYRATGEVSSPSDFPETKLDVERYSGENRSQGWVWLYGLILGSPERGYHG